LTFDLITLKLVASYTRLKTTFTPIFEFLQFFLLSSYEKLRNRQTDRRHAIHNAAYCREGCIRNNELRRNDKTNVRTVYQPVKV